MVVRSAEWLSNAAYVYSGVYCGGEGAEEIEGGRGEEVRLVVRKVRRAVVPRGLFGSSPQ